MGSTNILFINLDDVPGVLPENFGGGVWPSYQNPYPI